MDHERGRRAPTCSTGARSAAQFSPARPPCSPTIRTRCAHRNAAPAAARGARPPARAAPDGSCPCANQATCWCSPHRRAQRKAGRSDERLGNARVERIRVARPISICSSVGHAGQARHERRAGRSRAHARRRLFARAWSTNGCCISRRRCWGRARETFGRTAATHRKRSCRCSSNCSIAGRSGGSAATAGQAPKEVYLNVHRHRAGGRKMARLERAAATGATIAASTLGTWPRVSMPIALPFGESIASMASASRWLHSARPVSRPMCRGRRCA